MALRGEASLRRIGGETVFRGTLGVDRRLTLSNRDFYLVAEYQHDGLGAAGAAETSSVLESEAFTRGELQVLGRDEAAVQAQYQLHPSVEPLASLAVEPQRPQFPAGSKPLLLGKQRSHHHRRRFQGVRRMSRQAPRDRPPRNTAASAPPPTSR